MTFGTVIRNGRWLDGSGGPSAIRNIGIRDGHVPAVYPLRLDESAGARVIDATDKWVLPGLLDLRTQAVPADGVGAVAEPVSERVHA